ncbi:hypothetical protein F5146DRAFT_1002648 [Armillaria mellea]|nr:hypothetical protein F5146DRAFT_1002648 [Armillaria mellea]
MTTVQIQCINESWAELCQSVNQVLQVGNGDSHRIHLQLNSIALWEQYWTEDEGLKDHGHAPFQMVVDANRQAHTIHTPTRPAMSNISDDDLDKLIDGILVHCPGYG